MAARALDNELNKPTVAPSTAINQMPVNDLTKVVKKKKKLVEPEASTIGTGGEKRKAEEESNSPKEKKARLEETAS